ALIRLGGEIRHDIVDTQTHDIFLFLQVMNCNNGYADVTAGAPTNLIPAAIGDKRPIIFA
ncbi:MAG: hypothetical protein B7X55_13050, partial [Rhodobacterales bacterium 34-62-10]